MDMAIEAVGAVMAHMSGVGMAMPASRSVELSPIGRSGGATFSQTQSDTQLEVRFKEALQKFNGASPTSNAGAVPPAMKGLFNALDQINTEAKSVSDFAAQAEASGNQLTPGEMVMLTMKCQEFMFQAQLTSNIANRSSDGVQQLFRQQG
jgi:hypothetical protein